MHGSTNRPCLPRTMLFQASWLMSQLRQALELLRCETGAGFRATVLSVIAIGPLSCKKGTKRAYFLVGLLNAFRLIGIHPCPWRSFMVKVLI